MYNIFSSTFTGGNKTDLITGDFDGVIPASYDFRSLAVSDDGQVAFILTGYFNSDRYTGFDWKLYRANISVLLALQSSITISQAIQQGIFTEIAGDTGDPGYYWGLITGAGLLILIKGSELVLTYEDNPDFTEYTNPQPVPRSNVIFRRGDNPTDGEIGDLNINSIDFTWATLQMLLQEQQLAGEGDQKERPPHHHHHHIHHLAQAAQAAQPAGGTGLEESGGPQA